MNQYGILTTKPDILRPNKLNYLPEITLPLPNKGIHKGVTLAQLVKAYVGQADVQRFEPHLGHN